MKANKQRRMSNLAKKRRKAEKNRQLQLETLEQKQLLAFNVTFNPVSSLVEEPTTAGPYNSGPTLTIVHDGVGSPVLGAGETVEFNISSTTGEAADYSLFTFAVPAGNYGTAQTFDLIDTGNFVITPDSFVEGDEKFDLEIRPASYTGALQAFGNQINTHTIVDNEAARVDVQFLDGSVKKLENSSNFVGLKLETRDAAGTWFSSGGPTLEPGGIGLTAVVSVAGGTATVGTPTGNDYNALPGTQNVSIPAGSAAGTITPFDGDGTTGAPGLSPLKFNNDNFVEPDETIVFTVTPQTLPITTPFGVDNNTLTIDDDEFVNVSLVPVSSSQTVSGGVISDMVTEGSNVGDRIVNAVVSWTPGATFPGGLTIPVDLSGTATHGLTSNDADYGFDAPTVAGGVTGPGAFSITVASNNATGNMTQPIQIDAESGTRADAIYEGDESVKLKVNTTGLLPGTLTSSNTNYDLTIKDDELGVFNIQAFTAASPTTDVTMVKEGTDTYIDFKITVGDPNSPPINSGVGPMTVPFKLTGLNGANQRSGSPAVWGVGAPDFGDGFVTITDSTGTNPGPAIAGDGSISGNIVLQSTGVGSVAMATIRVSVDDNMVLESDDEGVRLELTTSGATASGTTTKEVTIKDDPDLAEASIVLIDSSAAEVAPTGSPPTTAWNDGKFKVQLSKPGTAGATLVTADTDTVVTLGIDNIAPVDVNDASFSDFTLMWDPDGSGPLGLTPLPGNQIVIKAGQTMSPDITVRITDDNIVETPEEIILKIVPDANGKVPSGDNTADITVMAQAESDNDFTGPRTITIADNDQAILNFYASDQVAGEPNNDGQFRALITSGANPGVPITASFPITVPYSTTLGATVPQVLQPPGFITAGGYTTTATDGAAPGTGIDYQTLSGSVTIPMGQSIGNVNVAVFDDGVAEPDEYVTAKVNGAISFAAGANVVAGATQEGVVKIVDNEGKPKIFVTTGAVQDGFGNTIVTGDDTAKENPNTDTGQFYVYIDRPVSTPFSVTYDFFGTGTTSTAMAGDLTGASSPSAGTINIPASSVVGLGTTVFGPFSVVANNDTAVEGDETVVMRLSGVPSSIDVGQATATVTIKDDDNSGLFVRGRSDAPENKANGTGLFDFGLTNAYPSNLNVKFRLNPVTTLQTLVAPMGVNTANDGSPVIAPNNIPNGAGNHATSSDFQVYTAAGFAANPKVPLIKDSSGLYQITIPASQTLQPSSVLDGVKLIVEGIDDLWVEGNEPVEVEIVSHDGPSAIGIGLGPGFGPAFPAGSHKADHILIVEDDIATVSLSVTDNMATEGSADDGQYKLTISNSQYVTLPLDVLLQFGPGANPQAVAADVVLSTASGPLAVPLTVPVPAFTNMVTVDVDAVNDVVVEPPVENLTTHLVGVLDGGSNPGQPVAGVGIDPFNSSGVVQIKDNDTADVYIDYGLVVDQQAFEEGANPDGVTVPFTTTDKHVPIILGLTQVSSVDQWVRFTVAGTTVSAADADAEYSGTSLGATKAISAGFTDPTVAGTINTLPADIGPNGKAEGAGFGTFGGDDFYVSAPASSQLHYHGLNPTTNRHEYSVKVAAGNFFAPVHMYAFDDGILEGVETGDFALKTVDTVTGFGAASTTLGVPMASSYTNSASRFDINPTITESDKATVKVTDAAGVDPNAATPANPDFILNENDVAPGAFDTDNAYFTVDIPVEGELDVVYRAMDDTATQTADYTAPVSTTSTTFTFVNAMTGPTVSAPIPINARNDSDAESTEQYKIVMEAATSHNNGGLVDKTDVGKVQILDNDVIVISGGQTTITELDGTGGANKTANDTTFNFTINPAGPAVPNGTVFTITTADGSAKVGALPQGGNDYVGITATVTKNGANLTHTTFASHNVTQLAGPTPDLTNDATYVIPIHVNHDDVLEGDQTFTFTVSAPGFQSVTKTITIKDDDATKITAVPQIVKEGATTAPLLVTADHAIEGTVTVKLKSENQTAIATATGNAAYNKDYAALAATTYTFTNTAANASQTSPAGTPTITTLQDAWAEIDETAGLDLHDLANPSATLKALVTLVDGTVTIDDDDMVTLTTTTNSPDPESIGTTPVKIKLTPTGGTVGIQQSMPVSVTTTDGAAIGGAFGGGATAPTSSNVAPDFWIPNDTTTFVGPLTLPAAGVTQNVNISIHDDSIVEASESFTGGLAVDFTNNWVQATGGTMNNVTNSGGYSFTIQDNDAAYVEITNETDAFEPATNGKFTVGLVDKTGNNPGKLMVTDVDTFVTIDIKPSSTADILGSVADYFFDTSDPNIQSFSTTGPMTGTLIVRIPAGHQSVTIDVKVLNNANPDAPVENIDLELFTVAAPIPATPNTRANVGLPMSPIPTDTDGSGLANVGTVNINEGGVATTRNFFVRGSTWGNTSTGYVAGSRPLNAGDTISQFNVDTLEVVYNALPSTTPSLTLTGTLAPGAPPTTIVVSGAVMSPNKATFTFPALADGRYKAVLNDSASTTLYFNVQHADSVSFGLSAGVVDFADFSFLSFSFNSTVPSGAAPSNSDFNGDGIVSFADFNFLSFKFGDNLTGFLLPPPPPAPASLQIVDTFFEDFGDDEEDDFSRFI